MSSDNDNTLETQIFSLERESIPKDSKGIEMSGELVVWIIAIIVIFLFFTSPSWTQGGQSSHKWTEKKNKNSKKIQAIDTQIRKISLKRRELESQINNLEMTKYDYDSNADESLIDIKIEKARIQIDELILAENDKRAQLQSLINDNENA